MILRYKGDGKSVSFIRNNLYSAKKISDKFGECYAIFDEGDDWYRYGVQFVEKNFDVLAETEISGGITSEPALKFA